MASLIRLHFTKPLVFSARLTFPQSIPRYNSSMPYARPGPPPLPEKDQREFEELIRRAQTPAAAPSRGTEAEAKLQLHPDARQPVEPDFEGNTNPVTGEIGGPKKEPLNWGAGGEWTYGGRATDF